MVDSRGMAKVLTDSFIRNVWITVNYVVKDLRLNSFHFINAWYFGNIPDFDSAVPHWFDEDNRHIYV